MARDKTINEEAGLPDWTPLESAPLIPAGPKPTVPAPPLSNVATPPQLIYFESSLSPDIQHDAYFVRTGYPTQSEAATPLMPMSPVGKATNNSATQSIAQIVVDDAISKIVFPASGLRWRGVWSVTDVYSINDVVTSNTSTYIALVVNSQVRPDTDTTKWSLVSENFAFDAVVETAGHSGFGVLDQVAATNAGATPLTSGPLTPAYKTGWGLWAISAENVTAVTSGWTDFGSIVGLGSTLLYLKSLTTDDAVSVGATTDARWAANLALFDGAGFSLTASVTSVQIASNVATCQCVSSFVVGTRVRCSGLVGASFLNAQTLVILSNTGTAFTAAFVHANYGPAADSGTATNYPFLQVCSVSLAAGLTFNNVFSSPVTAGSTILLIHVTSDVNASAPFSTVTDSHSASYTISNAISAGGIPANRPSSSVAIAHNVVGGSTTLTTVLTVNNSAPGANLYAIELPGGGASAIFAYRPYDVFQFRGSFFVCTTATALDAFDDPASWEIIAQGIGSTVPVTAGYQVLLEDWGRLIYNNTASNWTATLPAIVPPDGWMLSFQALSTGNLVINPNGANINGSASNITVVQNQGVMLYSDGTNYWTFRGFGTVFSVALSMPSIFSVAGSPITGSGTFTVTLLTQTANTIFAGPTTGAAATPTFRALVAADIPSLDAGKITTGQLALARGGTHADLSATGGTGQVLKQASAAADITVATLAASELSNGVIGSGAVVLAVSPTMTGTVALPIATLTGKVTTYNGIATVDNGLPSELGHADLTGQTAAKTATTLYLPIATGRFRISAYLKVTTVASVSSVLGPVTITFTDGTDSVAQSCVMLMSAETGAALTTNTGNATTSVLTGTMFIYAKTGVAIQYAIAYTSVNATEMVYAARLTCEAM